MLWVVVALSVHVPTYSSGETCVEPPHDHSTSQVVYLKGSGGLEIHIENDYVPFSTEPSNPTIIDWDATFRDKVDPSTYALYVGCGGCAPEDPIRADQRIKVVYDEGSLEPFTGTRYFSAVADKDRRKFNASLLSEANCPSKHFGIRLIDFGNRTDGSIIFWGAVIGLGESFTFGELLSFPLYILRNHGSVWNEQGWTWSVLLLLSLIAVPVVGWSIGKCGGDPFVGSGMRTIFTKWRFPRPLKLLLDLSLVGYLWAGTEQLVHLFYAQAGIPIGWGFWVGLIGVIGIFNAGPAAYATSRHWALHIVLKQPERSSECWTSSYWGILTVFLGGFLLVWGLGGGFFLGPIALFLAGCIELGNVCNPGWSYSTLDEEQSIELDTAPRRARTVPIKPAGEGLPPVLFSS
jgi:hypothetical protein